MSKLTLSILMSGVIYAVFKFFNEFGLLGIAEYQMWLIVLWVVSPFIVTFIASKIVSKNEKQQITILCGAIVISILGGYYYHTILVNYVGDKKGLIFITVPIYQWIALFVFLSILFFLRKK